MPGDQREDRIPSNMKDLLKFCMENTKAEDAPSAGASQVNVLGNEDREWLEGALNSLTESPVRRMKECIRILKSPNSENEDDDKEAALEELLEWCEYIDFAIGK